MTKRDLVMRIADETGLIQQDVHAVIQKSLDYIVDALNEGDTVEFRNLIPFSILFKLKPGTTESVGLYDIRTDCYICPMHLFQRIRVSNVPLLGTITSRKAH